MVAALKGRAAVQDPLGKKLLNTENPLAEADKLVQMLKEHAGKDIRSHIVAFDVAKRLDKPHLALRAARDATDLERSHPDAHCLRVQALLWLQERLPKVEIQVAREGMQNDLQKLTGVLPAPVVLLLCSGVE